MQEEQKETAAGSPVASFQTRRDKPIEVMSLQEKFIELRRQIPRIEKGQHSEEVPYKFAKIDDVWRAITPTMNELGVNFDIIQEENAQIKTMNTQHGGLMFLYESDLTMHWTNADNEDDTDEAQTHAIAWNDDPAKAKGSAWTYAIKYYLFEKFSIDMGETDPDMKGKPSAQTASQPVRNAAGNQQSQPNNKTAQSGQNGAEKKLTAAQLDRMYRKAQDAGLSKEQTDGRINYLYSKKPADMTRAEYDDICKRERYQRSFLQGWKSKGNRHRRGYKAPLPPDCSQWIGIDRLRLGKCLRHCGSLYCCRLWLYCGGQNSQGKELGHKVRNRPDDPELGEVQKIHGTENRRRSRPLERDHKLGENLRS